MNTRITEWKGGERSAHFSRILHAALDDLEYDDGVIDIVTHKAGALILEIGSMRDPKEYEVKVRAALAVTPYEIKDIQWSDDMEHQTGTFRLSKRIRESSEGFSSDDIQAYVQKYLNDHADLPKLVAYKVVASELNADYQADLTPGDVKLIFEGQQPVETDLVERADDFEEELTANQLPGGDEDVVMTQDDDDDFDSLFESKRFTEDAKLRRNWVNKAKAKIKDGSLPKTERAVREFFAECGWFDDEQLEKASDAVLKEAGPSRPSTSQRRKWFLDSAIEMIQSGALDKGHIESHLAGSGLFDNDAALESGKKRVLNALKEASPPRPSTSQRRKWFLDNTIEMIQSGALDRNRIQSHLAGSGLFDNDAALESAAKRVLRITSLKEGGLDFSAAGFAKSVFGGKTEEYVDMERLRKHDEENPMPTSDDIPFGTETVREARIRRIKEEVISADYTELFDKIASLATVNYGVDATASRNPHLNSTQLNRLRAKIKAGDKEIQDKAVPLLKSRFKILDAHAKFIADRILKAAARNLNVPGSYKMEGVYEPCVKWLDEYIKQDAKLLGPKPSKFTPTQQRAIDYLEKHGPSTLKEIVTSVRGEWDSHWGMNYSNALKDLRRWCVVDYDDQRAGKWSLVDEEDTAQYELEESIEDWNRDGIDAEPGEWDPEATDEEYDDYDDDEEFTEEELEDYEGGTPLSVIRANRKHPEDFDRWGGDHKQTSEIVEEYLREDTIVDLDGNVREEDPMVAKRRARHTRHYELERLAQERDARRKERDAKHADVRASNPVVHIAAIHTNFSGSWGVPNSSYDSIEGPLEDVINYYGLKDQQDKIYNAKTLVSAYNKTKGKDAMKNANDARERGYSSGGYKQLMVWSPAFDTSHKMTKEEKLPKYPNLTYYDYETPRSAF